MGSEQPHPLDLAVDGTFPQVRYERELTVGSVGTLWLGRLTTGSEAGRTVFLRRMSLDLFSAKDVDSLRLVAQAYSKVRHPSLLKLLGVITQDRDLISVSEHLDGVRLSDLMRHACDNDAPLPATVAVRIVLDAARATIKAHRLASELGLYPVERLFVPEGVFVASFGGTLLTEIGMLAAVARCAQPRNIPDLLAQLSPEELDKSGPAKSSPEVFSLGVILWEALANRGLFSRDSARQTLDELLRLPIDPLHQVERCGMPVPEALAEVVKIATQRHPSARYATLEQFAAALEQLPAHFIAAEHHVAAALRKQANHLLQAFHVDPSQSSLTVAFSEVPVSRCSTRPPPEGGHNWDPPTFNQSSLVSGSFKALNLQESGIVSESLRGEVPVSSIVPEPATRSPRRKRLLLLGASLLALTALLSVAYLGRKKSLTLIQPEPPGLPAGNAVESGEPATPHAGLEPIAGIAKTTLATEPQAPDPALARGPQATRVKASSSTEPIASSAIEVVVPTPVTKQSGTAYRPRQIAPYRPKGI